MGVGWEGWDGGREGKGERREGERRGVHAPARVQLTEVGRRQCASSFAGWLVGWGGVECVTGTHLFVISATCLVLL